jgi:hypothetical protein
VLACDLGEQPAKLGRPSPRELGGAGGDERAQRLQRDLVRGPADGARRLLEQRGPRALEGGAAAHLALQALHQDEHLLGVARAHGGALLEHELEQLARGGDLGVEVGEQVEFERHHPARSFSAA